MKAKVIVCCALLAVAIAFATVSGIVVSNTTKELNEAVDICVYDLLNGGGKDVEAFERFAKKYDDASGFLYLVVNDMYTANAEALISKIRGLYKSSDGSEELLACICELDYYIELIGRTNAFSYRYIY